MFGFNYFRLDKERVEQHLGTFQRRIGLSEAVALIFSGTIGAGILGLPYAVAKVGSLIGIFYIIAIGALMIGFNLLVGEIAVRTKGDFHLVGMAGKYLGQAGKGLMTILVYLVSFGILVIYIIGEGESLSALFGGSPLAWGLFFWLIGSLLVVVGLRVIKVMDVILSLLLLSVIIFIITVSTPNIELINFSYHNWTYFLLPFGVILFAFSGSGSVLEAHSLIGGDRKLFRKAILIAGGIIMAIYLVFALVVLGVTGAETTEIATIGLGNKIGSTVFWLGNIFAALAMATSFITNSLLFRDSLRWDYRLPSWKASLLVCGVPFVLYLFGLRGFIMAIDLIGGVFFSTEMLLIILIYWQAKRKGDLPVGPYKLHHTWLLVALLILLLMVGGIYSVVKLF
ncbi:MAG: hypothetical protein A2921_01915 [Candidatus Magasanikbacteria bacterium RIFCSPLOWO2_01_FULL_43_20b]|uniref:Amino acid transporter transmembrane domain-containing protein n=1 Tax=Candidatus Magasanikbacteria bacterium RIFCSPLOWO2_12_FULL_43_12 TaxID=1798692 RepID=A0A1F6MQP9_9BACT|nr:MAG: hypothetical protein A3C74_02135 [Candidatus Magasanikbacteria bacterium RIFCSPHIGHO2_02_FULL_44_13]OGH71983.1 MAG: hypothetical protein A3I93_03115 [Candidatus Magasanikbacteria bacterium RIFCSPLOWO2_02_FULL_43_22]OGH73047.1 MAG: hypothetical protein A2921_01915 [Candidatus Magasanikbacteria bacterium RIFCSPLOWO2_01_FULL_43_20b]OGH73986.1 MAG: hypothetical protein A3G00_03720 [Candidatus Magasanikbacteria bacterium RIFCSPLOWO2_12_FULL_43_12]